MTENHRTYGTLDSLQRKLDGRFFRCHRSFLLDTIGAERKMAYAGMAGCERHDDRGSQPVPDSGHVSVGCSVSPPFSEAGAACQMGLIVLAVRYGLRLDGSGFEAWLSTFGAHATPGVLLLMTAAVVLFFLITEAFCRILSLTWQEREAALLMRLPWRTLCHAGRSRYGNVIPLLVRRE